MAQCKHCGHQWNYHGNRTVANCPKCGYKVFNVQQGLNTFIDSEQGLTKHRVNIETSEDRIRLVPIGDIHVGAPGDQCEWVKLQGELNYILTRHNTFMIGMGDYMDFAQKMPWRRGPNVYLQSLNPQQQYDKIFEAFKPLAQRGKILGLHWGNHEQWIVEETGFNPIKTLCQALNVPMLGPACETTVTVNKRFEYVIYSTHGFSSARLKHTKLGALISSVKDIYADIYLYGHTHQLASTRGAKRFKGREFKVYYVLTGHFLKWDGSYAQLFGLDPSPSGCSQIKLFADRKDAHVSI